MNLKIIVGDTFHNGDNLGLVLLSIYSTSTYVFPGDLGSSRLVRRLFKVKASGYDLPEITLLIL